jgi:hypothetical protein
LANIFWSRPLQRPDTPNAFVNYESPPVG